jgi:hypothetical protein
MTRRAKISLIIAGSFLLIGTLVCVIGLAVVNFDFNKLETDKYEQKVYTADPAGLSALVAGSANQSVKVVPTTGSQITITYYESSHEHYTFANEGGKLVMTYIENRKLFPLSWFSFHLNAGGVVIELPASFSGSLRLETSNAAINLNDVSLIGPVDLHTSNGLIDLGNVSTTGEISAKTSNQRIRMNTIVAAKVQAQTSNGRIDAAAVEAGQMVLETSNNRIELASVKVGLIDLQTSNGRISGTIVGRSADYRIISKTSNGSNSLTNLGGTGPNSLTAKTSNGAIDLHFTE